MNEDNSVNNPKEAVDVEGTTDINITDFSDLEEVDAAAESAGASEEAAVKKSGKGLMIAIGLIIALLCVAGIGAYAYFYGGSEETAKNEPAVFFVKDDVLMMYKTDWDAPQAMSEIDERIGTVVYKTNGDGFYYTEIDEDDYEDSDLYYVDMSQKLKEGEKYPVEKISGNAGGYYLDLFEDQYLVYQKNDTCYVYDGTDSTKLGDDIYTTIYSQGKIICLGYDSLFIKDLASLEEKETVAKGNTSVVYYTEGFAEVMYAENLYDEYTDEYSYDLYLYKDGEKTRVVKDISDYSYDEGTAVYYKVKSGETSISLYDFLEDSMAASDAKAEEPELESYSSYEYDEFWDEYYETYDWDTYYDACEAYYAAMDRNSMRDVIQEEKITVNLCDYYIFENGKEEKIAENVIYSEFHSGIPMVICMDEDAKLPKICDLTEVDSVYELQEETDVYSKLLEALEVSVALDGRHFEVLFEAGDQDYNVVSDLLSIKNVGDQTYFVFINYDQSYAYNIMVADKKDGKITGLTEVGLACEYFYLEDTVYYYEYIGEDNRGDLYRCADGKAELVDIDADSRYGVKTMEGGKLVYVVDSDDEGGTLVVNDNGTKNKLAENVSWYEIIDGDLYYIISTSSKREIGDLMLYKDDASIKLGSDVEAKCGYSYMSDGRNFSSYMNAVG